jgi:hypothetical protein
MAKENPAINVFSPFGQLLVNQRDEDVDFDCSMLAGEYPTTSPVAENEETETTIITAHTLDGDMEDAMADELP